MFDVELGERLLRTCDYRFPTVLCPHKKKLADVTLAKWQIANDAWTSWTVIDCTLLPAGEVWCDKSCLSLLENHLH
jgi:hypothetical protein